MRAKLNQALSIPFTLLDAAGAKVTGQLDGAFSKLVTFEGANNGATVTIAEISGQAGRYTATFTPNAIGRWELEVTHTATGRILESDEPIEVGLDARAVCHVADDSGQAYVVAWLEADGERVIGNVSNCSVVIRDSGGSAVYTGSDGTADANGMFAPALVAFAPTDNRAYRAEVSIDHTVLGTVTTAVGLGTAA